MENPAPGRRALMPIAENETEAAGAVSLELLVVAACTAVVLAGVAWTVRRSDR
jgi:hypothetical protein